MLRPARHHDVLFMIGQSLALVAEQGFLTSDGEFVDRCAAALIATMAGQITNPRYGNDLHSEDLW